MLWPTSLKWFCHEVIIIIIFDYRQSCHWIILRCSSRWSHPNRNLHRWPLQRLCCWCHLHRYTSLPWGQTLCPCTRLQGCSLRKRLKQPAYCRARHLVFRPDIIWHKLFLKDLIKKYLLLWHLIVFVLFLSSILLLLSPYANQSSDSGI